MKFIVSGIFSFIGLLLIFIINLLKGKGVVGILVSPIIGGAVIFGIVFGVLLLLSKILNVDSILTEKQEEKAKDTSGNSSPVGNSVGNNVNFTVGDDDNETADIVDSAPSASGNDNDLPESGIDKQVSFSDMESDSDDTAEPEAKNESDNFTSHNENFSMKKPMYGVPPEEIIKDKLGVVATPEDIAKGIKTILKRQGGLSDDKQS